MVHQAAKYILGFWILLNLFFTVVPTSYAQSSGGVACGDLNGGAKTKDWVITIAEEQFGSNPKDDDPISQDANSFTKLCVRKTTCSEGAPAEGSEEAEPGECRSEYVDTGACAPSDTVICQTVRVFGSKSGLGLLFLYIGILYRWVAATIGIVAVFYIIYGGIKISTAGDNTAAVDEAKTKIIQAIAGLILLFISAVVLFTINPNFFTL